MSGFTETEWVSIYKTLEKNPAKYGIPIRRNKSVIIGSFNALKLGKDHNDSKKWSFLKRIISRYDLIAIQEVMDDLSGIRRLHKSLGAGFGLLLSDTTGATPGSKGLKERLAFIYKTSRINLNELVSDITYDRSELTKKLQQDIDLWKDFFDHIENKNKERVSEGKKPKSLSKFSHPTFLNFIRTPYCASFSIKGKNHKKNIEFLAVNAHTLYGNNKHERTREFNALFDWIIKRTKSAKKMYYKNMILMGDLNLYFDDEKTKKSDIILRMIELESTLLKGKNAARVNFPFLDVHPSQTNLFNTNARKTETFDHIAFFINPKELSLPLTDKNKTAEKKGENGYDYGVVDFVELIAQSLYKESFYSLSKSKRNDFLKKIKHDISDHMPIWSRLPMP